MVNILNYSSKKEKMVNIPIGCPRTQSSFGKKNYTSLGLSPFLDFIVPLSQQ